MNILEKNENKAMCRVAFRASNGVNGRSVSPIAMTTVTFQNGGKLTFNPISSLSLTSDNITNNHTNINDAWNSFKSYLISIIDIHAPMIKKNGKGSRLLMVNDRHKIQNEGTRFSLEKSKMKWND